MGGGGFRAEAVSYIDENGETQNTTGTVTEWNSSTTNFSLSGGWYYVTGTVNANGDITLPNSGTVNLILGDGFTLTATKIDGFASLVIYGQSAGTGTLKIENSSEALIQSRRGVTINGGNINISSENGSAYINSIGVTISGGQVTVTGQGSNPGIICASGKSITLGYTNTDDFIQASGYYNYSSNSYTAATPKIADGKIFVN